MTTPRRSIPLLQFCAGTLKLGIAAEDVLAVDPEVDLSDVHVATVFGVEPAQGERRTVSLPAATPDGDTVSIAFQADAPFQVVTCEHEQILPMPVGVDARRWHPVIGFARTAQELILLLDIPSLVAKLLDQRERQQS